ncbi:LemA family protein [uncultured Psychromonas sp.]|uniref:LemA family protein n=1 Tax=uncultured Psychromonas sp. TaxID=173974 RepID=UPI0026213AF3|nr:LemA family protein [uncultured Psychromonas sp.]
MTDLFIIFIIVFIIFLTCKFFINIYNRLVMLKFNTDKAFANIDILLMQRADEIPNLVKVLDKHTTYEKDTLQRLTELRTRCKSVSNQDEKVATHNEMTSLLGGVMAVYENYPELKSNASFLALQQRVSALEDNISDRREFFNESINLYNIGTKQFPDLLLAKLMSFELKSLLIVTDEEKRYDGI